MKLFNYIGSGVAVTLLFCLCSKSPTAGGSSDSGNVKFAGIVYHDSDGPAAGVKVTLCPDDYPGGLDEDSTESDSSLLQRTITDTDGRFEFRSIQEGGYLIEVNDGVSEALLINVSIQDTGSPLFVQDTLRPWSVLEGTVDHSTTSAGQQYVVVYGIDRRVKVESDGHFRIPDLPEGTYRFKVISTDSLFTPVEVEGIVCTSDDTVNIPLFGWEHHATIHLNTTTTGADITEDIYDFPVLVRLTEENIDFDEAAADGSDCRFTGQNGKFYSYEIDRWNSTLQQAEIWVKVDTVFGNSVSQYFRMHWGNSGAASMPASGLVFDTATGFQAVWHLSDTDYDSATDATLNHFNGVPEGMDATSVVEGVIGNAREFDGFSKSIPIPNSQSGKLNFPEDANYTLSAWVYADRPEDGSQVVISKGDEQYFLCSVEGTKDGPFWRFIEFKESVGWQHSSISATGNEWVYLTGVRKGEEQYLYLNGELGDSDISILDSDKERITDLEVAIGKFMEKDGKNGDSYFNGRIDEVRICNVSLSADWIRLCYMNQRADDRLLRFEKSE